MINDAAQQFYSKGLRKGLYRGDVPLEWMRAWHRHQIERLAREYPELEPVLMLHLEKVETAEK